MQTKLIYLRKLLKEQKIKYQNLKLDGQSIKFKTSEENLKIFEELFLNKDNLINTFYNKYNSYEMNYSIKDNFVLINYSKYGVIEVKSSALNQSLEIVRRRIDEIGTNEPTIVRRGNDRILVELPGLDDPNRIKNLLGKTANLSFRIVSESDDAFGSELLFFEDGKSQLNVNKRVVISGDNLTTAKPKFDSRNNETIVTFTLDRVGAKRFGRVTTNNVGKRLAIILDNKIISAPQIREPIIGGNGQISGNFTFQSATDLALLLRSGALPAPLNIVEERTKSPSGPVNPFMATTANIGLDKGIIICQKILVLLAPSILALSSKSIGIWIQYRWI